jgi:predicted MFS family arabinose efflux permease
LVIAGVAFIFALVAFRAPGAYESEESVAVSAGDLRGIYTDPVLSRLGAMTFMGMGVFNGLATWLEVLLRPAGVSSSTTGWMLVVLTVAGVAGAIILPPRVAGREAERGYLQIASLVGAVVFALLAATDVVPVVFAALGVLGFFLLAAQPVILEISERRAGHAAASAAGAILLAGNLGGIVIAVLVQTVNGSPSVAFILLGVAMLLIAPIARSLPQGFGRAATPPAS